MLIENMIASVLFSLSRSCLCLTTVSICSHIQHRWTFSINLSVVCVYMVPKVVAFEDIGSWKAVEVHYDV